MKLSTSTVSGTAAGGVWTFSPSPFLGHYDGPECFVTIETQDTIGSRGPTAGCLASLHVIITYSRAGIARVVWADIGERVTVLASHVDVVLAVKPIARRSGTTAWITAFYGGALSTDCSVQCSVGRSSAPPAAVSLPRWGIFLASSVDGQSTYLIDPDTSDSLGTPGTMPPRARTVQAEPTSGGSFYYWRAPIYPVAAYDGNRLASVFTQHATMIRPEPLPQRCNVLDWSLGNANSYQLVVFGVEP